MAFLRRPCDLWRVRPRDHLVVEKNMMEIAATAFSVQRSLMGRRRMGSPGRQHLAQRRIHARQKRQRQTTCPFFSDYPAYVSLNRGFTFTLQITPSIRIMIVQSIMIPKSESQRWQRKCDGARSGARSATHGSRAPEPKPAPSAITNSMEGKRRPRSRTRSGRKEGRGYRYL